MQRIVFALTVLASLAPVPALAEAPVPEATARVAPIYPVTAESLGLKGAVKARVTVDGQGAVTAVDVLDEQPAGFDFGSAAVEALRQWSFQPGRPGRKIVTVNFKPMDGSVGRDVEDFASVPQPTKRVNPRYPAKAENRWSQGEAHLLLVIDGTGRPSDVRLLGELPEDFGFGESALKAARQWEFQPGRPGAYTLTVRFMIEGGKPGISWYDLKKAPDPTHRVEPVVPARAVEKDRTGRVKLAFATDSSGRVTTVRVVEERPKDFGFGDAAKAALSQWRFEGSPEAVYRLQMTISPP